MTPSCLTCRHAEPVNLDDQLAVECRRYPPTHFTQDGETRMVYPQVFEDDWCGEYQPERNKTT